MDIGVSIAASAMVATERGTSIYANDLANANTPAFSASVPLFAGLTATMRPNATLATSVPGAGQEASIGQGVYLAGQEPAGKAPVLVTGVPTDVAVEGGYFAVDTPAGVAYTRDGGFGLDAAGNLVTQLGQKVLSSTGQPIAVPQKDAGTVRIDAQGNVLAGGKALAKLGVATFPNPQGLVPAGSGVFVPGPNAGPRTFGAAGQGVRLTPGAILGSSTDVSATLTALVESERSFQLDAHALGDASQMLAWAAQIT